MSTHTNIEEHFLPQEMRIDLCMSLLEAVGASGVRLSEDRGEILHCCVMPWHDERRPSAALNFNRLAYKCLSGDTLVKTYDGERRIEHLDGQTVLLLDGNGKWVRSPVRKYGRERLYRVTLSRNGHRKEVYTTADHRWYVRPKGRPAALRETTTKELNPRQRIPSVWTHNVLKKTLVSPVGVMAGFVFGDGTQTKHGAVANFVGDKDEALLSYFGPYEVRRYGNVAKVIRGLPRSWKKLPSLSEGQSYLYGWLAGYFAADGCVADDGHVTLSSSQLATLDHVRAICDRLGIGTYTTSTQSRVGISGEGLAERPSDIHQLSFRSSSLCSDFFLIPKHKDRWERAQARRTYDRTHWWVVSVEETDRVEDVYCAEVPTTNSFVLADNLLTGNCLGCQTSGGLYWLAQTVLGTSPAGARDWIGSTSGLGGKEFDLPLLLQFLDSLDEAYASPRTRPSLPRYPEQALTAWQEHVYPGLTTGVPDLGIQGRGIPEDNLRAAGVGWDMDANRVVIPLWMDGSLVGWQSRRIVDDGTEKYRSTPDFPRDTAIMGLPHDRSRVVVVESPMSYLRHMHHAPVAATFGASISQPQLQRLKWYGEVTFAVDNDAAGWATIEGRTTEQGEHVEGAAGVLSAYTRVTCWTHDWHADPADMDEALFDLIDSERVPYPVWSRPTGTLRCFVCKREHTGGC